MKVSFVEGHIGDDKPIFVSTPVPPRVTASVSAAATIKLLCPHFRGDFFIPS